MKRSAGEETKVKILEAGLKLWPNINPTNIAHEAGLSSHASVIYHYSSGELRNAVAQWAILNGHSRIILQLIGMGHDLVADMTPEEKRAHFEAV